MCPESPIFELFLHIIVRTLQSVLSLQQIILRGLVAKVETDRRKLLPDSALTLLHSMLWIVLGLHYTLHVHPRGLLELGNQEHMSLLRHSSSTQSSSSEQTAKPPCVVTHAVVAPAETAARHHGCELPDTDQQAAHSSQIPPPLPPCYSTTACFLSPIDSERAEAAFENNEEKENKPLLTRDKSGNIVSAYKYQYSILAEEALRTFMSCIGLSVKLASSGIDSLSSSSFSSNRGNPTAVTLQERLRILQTESIIHVARYVLMMCIFREKKY
jgi:hypothetical protein